jgi:predicted dehydrogenase
MLAEKFTIPKTYSDLDEMLSIEKPDLVDICTPPDTHAVLLAKSLERGFPCLVEKPLTTTTSDADHIIRLSERNGIKVFVIHNYSYVPCVRKARDIVEHGRIGSVRFAETRYLTNLSKERYCSTDHWVHRLPAGVLTSEITPHLLMLLVDFLGNVAEAKSLVAKVGMFRYVTADELKMILVSAKGAVGHLMVSYNSPAVCHTMDIFGEKACLFLDFVTQSVVLQTFPLQIRDTNEASRSSMLRGKWAAREIIQKTTSLVRSATNVAVGRYEMLSEGHRFLIKRCLDDLSGISKYPVDLNKCREVVRLMESVYSDVHDAARITRANESK